MLQQAVTVTQHLGVVAPRPQAEALERRSRRFAGHGDGVGEEVVVQGFHAIGAAEVDVEALLGVHAGHVPAQANPAGRFVRQLVGAIEELRDGFAFPIAAFLRVVRLNVELHSVRESFVFFAMRIVDGALCHDARLVVEQVGWIDDERHDHSIAEQLHDVLAYEVRVGGNGSNRAVGKNCGSSHDGGRGERVVDVQRPVVGHFSRKLLDESAVRVSCVKRNWPGNAFRSRRGPRPVRGVHHGQVGGVLDGQLEGCVAVSARLVAERDGRIDARR